MKRRMVCCWKCGRAMAEDDAVTRYHETGTRTKYGTVKVPRVFCSVNCADGAETSPTFPELVALVRVHGVRP